MLGFLGSVLGGIGSFFGNNAGDLIGIGASAIGAREQADATRDASREAAEATRYAADRAAESARLGFDYLAGNPFMNQAQGSGRAALEARNALLGLGGDEEAARAAFDNYLDSTGFQFALESGRDALAGSRAARGLLDSGTTAESMTMLGNQMGRQAFDNYLAQLTTDGNFGLQAATATGSAGSSAGATAAGVQSAAGNALANNFMNAGANQANIEGAMWENIAGGLGNIFGRD